MSVFNIPPVPKPILHYVCQTLILIGPFTGLTTLHYGLTFFTGISSANECMTDPGRNNLLVVKVYICINTIAMTHTFG
jgi:hypothetical protein